MTHTWGYVPFPTHNILALTVPSEFNALTDNQKEIYKMIISCGCIDSHPGDVVMEKLLSLFPEGTGTRTNIENFLTVTPPGP